MPVLKVRDPNTGLYVPLTTGLYLPAVSGRNKIINGDFSVNQRGFTSGSAVGVSLFGFDRWAATAAGGTCTYSAQTAVLGELPESARSFARIVTSGQSASNSYASFVQWIESVRTLSGKTVTVSFWARAASGTPMVSLEIQQRFGSGGSPSAMVLFYAGKVTISTTWTRYSIVVTIPSVVGKTLGTAPDDAVSMNFWTSAGSDYSARTGSLPLQNATIDFWGVQVEEGPVPTLFEQRTYAQELQACMRYFQRYSGATGGFWPNTTIFRVGLPLTVPLRAQPAVGLTSAGVVNWASGATSSNSSPTTVTLNGWSVQGLYVDLPGLVGGVQGGVGVWYSQLLDLNSEL